MRKVGANWFDRASPKPIHREQVKTGYEIAELSRVKSPISGDGEWWKYKLVFNDNVMDGYRCGTEEDMRKFLNIVTGKINNRLFGHIFNKVKLKL
jgi:hypothetical protein